MAISPIFKRLSSIRHTDPELTPKTWCQMQPCRTIKLGSHTIILTQPSSSFFVYFLGILTVGVGITFLRSRGDEVARLSWGISLVLWGLGALLAGTSHQAFGYQIKCAGRETCSWTSWWEVIYLIFHQLSLDALLVAVAYSCTQGTMRAVLLGYALICAVIYTLVTFIGGIILIEKLITFELMVWISSPIFLFFVIVNSWRYSIYQSPMDLVLIGAWGWLLITMLAYWLYDKLGFTSKLWAKGDGVWFSQNDVLHIGLIIWMAYIAVFVVKHVSDFV